MALLDSPPDAGRWDSVSSWASGTNRVESRGEGVLFGGLGPLFFFIFQISGTSGFNRTLVILEVCVCFSFRSQVKILDCLDFCSARHQVRRFYCLKEAKCEFLFYCNEYLLSPSMGLVLGCASPGLPWVRVLLPGRAPGRQDRMPSLP